MKQTSSLIGLLSVFICCIFSSLTASLLDLEDECDDFVLETRKIEIPNFPFAFNVGVVKWNDLTIMSFRNIANPKKPFESHIGLVLVNNDFLPIGEAQILDLRFDSPVPSRAEDARLIVIGEKLYMVYSDNVEPRISKGGFRVYLCEIIYIQGYFFAQNIECLSCFEGESINIREKNWVPFEYNKTLLLAYSLLPHRIFRPLFDTGFCETLYETFPHINWNWGELRGGTVGLPIDDFHYLSFFHSSLYLKTVHSEGKNVLHYFLGAYLFLRSPPFEMTHVSAKPIIGKNFYHGEKYKPYWKPVRVVFPCGFLFDKEYIWMVYGRQDHEAWVAKIDKKRLLESLVPVQTEGMLGDAAFVFEEKD